MAKKKVYGVCLSQNNVFYTNEEQYIYGVKKTGGGIGEVRKGNPPIKKLML